MGVNLRLFYVLQLVCEGHLRSFTGKTYTRLWARLTCACGIHLFVQVEDTLDLLSHPPCHVSYHYYRMYATFASSSSSSWLTYSFPHDFHISFMSVIRMNYSLKSIWFFLPSSFLSFISWCVLLRYEHNLYNVGRNVYKKEPKCRLFTSLNYCLFTQFCLQFSVTGCFKGFGIYIHHKDAICSYINVSSTNSNKNNLTWVRRNNYKNNCLNIR